MLLFGQTPTTQGISNMKTLVVFLATVLFSSIVNAESFDYEKMCEKVKSCALAEISKTSEVPPGMEDVFAQMFDAQCASMLTAYTQKFDDANINKQADACASSIYDMSCDELMASQGDPTTPACKDFEKAAEDAGIDLKNIDLENKDQG